MEAMRLARADEVDVLRGRALEENMLAEAEALLADAVREAQQLAKLPRLDRRTKSSLSQEFTRRETPTAVVTEEATPFFFFLKRRGSNASSLRRSDNSLYETRVLLTKKERAHRAPRAHFIYELKRSNASSLRQSSLS